MEEQWMGQLAISTGKNERQTKLTEQADKPYRNTVENSNSRNDFGVDMDIVESHPWFVVLFPRNSIYTEALYECCYCVCRG